MKVIQFGEVKGNKINHDKLKEARIARGLSLAKLSEKIGVTSQALSQYETGKCKPNPSVFLKIVEELDFPISFYTDISMYDNEEMVYFRSNKNITKKLKDACIARIGWVDRMYNMIDSYLTIPKINIPYSKTKDIEELDLLEIEDVANELRKKWKLGDGPISNIVDLLQKNGFVITRLEIGSKKVDAFSVWKNGTPYIFLGSDKESAVRSRFDLAHELGHLILHKNLDVEDFEENQDKLEKQADMFAISFLLPRESFNNEIISSSIDSFILLKRKWKVSLAAMIRRAQDTEMLTDNQIRYLKSQMIKYGYYKKEPLDDKIKYEKPYLFKQAFEVMVRNGIMTAEDLLEKIKLNKSEAISLFSLEEGFFDRDKDNFRLIEI